MDTNHISVNKCFLLHQPESIELMSANVNKAASFVSIYHTSEQYFSRVLIGQLGGDQRSTIHLRAAEEKQSGFCCYIFTNKVTLWAASYSACVVYTKTIIHLSVGESGGYLPPLR